MYSSPYTGRNSYGKTYGEHREALEFGETEYAIIKALCRELGIDFAATAFDITAAKFLSRIGRFWKKSPATARR
jgi:N-acetylneuraminate synthase/sialic acid synthase